MTHQKILAMLAGCSSQKPMPFDDLVKASGLLPATLGTVLMQMAHNIPATINCASITKDGKTQMVYWPTGVIEKATQHIVINRQKAIAGGFSGTRQPLSALRPQASAVQPTTSIPTKEIPMGMPPRKLNTLIYDKVAEQPGIAQDDLIAFALPKVTGATEKQVKKTIANLVHASQRIRSVGPRGNFTYFPNNEAHQPAAAASSTVKKQEVKPASYGVGEKEFSLTLTDDNWMKLHLGAHTLLLDPSQTGRLQDFMGRITLKGNRV